MKSMAVGCSEANEERTRSTLVPGGEGLREETGVEVGGDGGVETGFGAEVVGDEAGRCTMLYNTPTDSASHAGGSHQCHPAAATVAKNSH